MVEKHFEEQVGKKLWKIIYAQGMLPLQRSREKNHLNFFYFGCATQNKALDMMKVCSFKNFLFHQRIYGVISFKRIDNGPNFTTISTIATRKISKNI